MEELLLPFPPNIVNNERRTNKKPLRNLKKISFLRFRQCSLTNFEFTSKPISPIPRFSSKKLALLFIFIFKIWDIMESTMKISYSVIFPINSTPKLNSCNKISYGFGSNGSHSISKICAVCSNGSVSASDSHRAESRVGEGSHRRRSSLESLFCYDKPIPEERIEEPVGVSLAEKIVGDNPHCTDCRAKGAVLCITCSGSGLYVDPIMESQGIIVKVRCLGCGGSGNIMCSECGGRGHLGPK
ncbi:uncharacterized protein LOC111296299 [Durio zibethinus]|uniref:Uncharacterized protein LOC111296299 n=1 Tax=Durio zibethinus TaxID=66656 RepID=A0A6P5Z1T1_DURZI|nr:uncharacterized protein LOC111296299 [Durio zibethinus]XP_022746277.1 uncharacterized protein LOC111296299 [Durio zibethinus]